MQRFPKCPSQLKTAKNIALIARPVEDAPNHFTGLPMASVCHPTRPAGPTAPHLESVSLVKMVTF